MEIVEKRITKRHVKCDCGKITQDDCYSFWYKFSGTKKVSNHLTLRFFCMWCNNDFVYEGTSWKSLRMISSTVRVGYFDAFNVFMHL